MTRGFGDHELRAQFSEVFIKPFLTPQPEVQVIDTTRTRSLKSGCDDEHEEERVLVMGTDGLWDVTSNERAAAVVCAALDHSFSSPSGSASKTAASMEQVLNKYRFISAAQDLVMASRGKLRTGQEASVVNGEQLRRSGGGQGWKTSEEKSATIDDISVFVIPLQEFERESREWTKGRTVKMRRTRRT